MGEISIIGLDLAKQVFQVHGARVDGSVVLRKKITRGQLLAFFFKAATLHRRHGSLCNGPLLGNARSVSLVMRSGWSHPPM